MTPATPSPPGRAPRTRFTQERRVFDRLRSDCSVTAQREYELAVQTLVERYNTTIYENRFIAGGAVEVFTYALLRSVGISCNLYGDQAKGGDILLPRDRKLSVKSNLVGVRPVRLLNKMGKRRPKWNTATLFVVAGIGIVFGAPDMVASSHLETTGDALVLRTRGLRALINKPSNVVPMDIARKPPTEVTGFSHKASTAVARQILLDMESHDLLRAFSSADGQQGI